jgi:hypothetical protein
VLSFRDFSHHPQVDPIIEKLTHDGPGLILVAGMGNRAHIAQGGALPSGRAGIFRTLVRQLLESDDQLTATIIAESRDAFRVPRNLFRRVRFEIANSPEAWAERIASCAQLRPGLLVIDRITPANAAITLETAQNGCRVITQMDTIFRGAEVVRALLEWEVPRGRLRGLRWVVAVQRIPMLCECKQPASPDRAVLKAIHHRYPHLEFGVQRPP